MTDQNGKCMEWNGVRLNEYRPGAVEWVGKGLGAVLWTLFYLSPNAFLPYLVFRALDDAQAPLAYVLLIAIGGGICVYWGTHFVFWRLQAWKKKGGGFTAQAVISLAMVLYLAARVWLVEAGTTRITRSWHTGHELAVIAAVVYLILALRITFQRTARRQY